MSTGLYYSFMFSPIETVSFQKTWILYVFCVLSKDIERPQILRRAVPPHSVLVNALFLTGDMMMSVSWSIGDGESERLYKQLEELQYLREVQE